MINTTTQLSQSNGEINYLIIEYLKSIPFNDNNKKEQLIKKVSLKINNYPILFCLFKL